jgi:hypothetical protein
LHSLRTLVVAALDCLAIAIALQRVWLGPSSPIRVAFCPKWPARVNTDLANKKKAFRSTGSLLAMFLGLKTQSAPDERYGAIAHLHWQTRTGFEAYAQWCFARQSRLTHPRVLHVICSRGIGFQPVTVFMTSVR